MGRLFSVLLLSAAMLCPAGETQDAFAQPVFFSMLFPQLLPQWMTGDAVVEVML